MPLRRPFAAHPPRQRHALARAAWLLLWLALCLAPWVGRMHQVLHVPGMHGQALQPGAAAPGPTADAGIGHTATHTPPQTRTPWHAHHGSDCLLFDHLALADALCSTVQALAAVPPQAVRVAWQPTGVQPLRLRGFEARAPPMPARA